MKRYWPFLLFAAAVVVHHVYLFVDPQFWTKGLLMSTLLIAVLLIALWTDRGIVSSRRSIWVLSLLCLALALSGIGDVVLHFSFEFGVAAFAAAQIVFIALFAGPARSRAYPWWAIPYALLYSPVIAVLWSHLGPYGALIAIYGLLLLAMAVASVVVGPMVAFGGFVFLVSESFLGIRLFVPEWLSWFPDPYQDVMISLLYCVGQGLIAFGVLQRIVREPELAEIRRQRRIELASARYTPTIAN